MIPLTRLNHTSLVLNSDLIECIEVTPDTVISLTTGQKLVVLETAEEVVERVLEFRRAIFSGILRCPRLEEAGPAGASRNPAQVYGRDHGEDS